VVHIKYSNPNFDINGSHLYGQSPLKSALKNIESANEALTQNIKTLKNSGAFGFIHGKQQPLNPDQAQELKDRLREMDNSPERLSNIAGVSAEVGFTRLTLTTYELQPFAYLSYDEKQLCNVLGWSDKLLNNDAGAKYSNIQESRKQVVTDDIMPDLGLLEQAFNDVILPKYTKYANTMLYFDVSTLPEMQLDMASLTSWLTRALKDGVINRNEYREALNYPILEEEEMDVYTVSGKLNPLERALEEDEKPPMPGVPGLPAPKGKPNAEKKNLITNKAGFDPKQVRGADGQWSKNPGGASPCSFKGWFKDSKVVDANGEPEVFYHGTTHDFDEFTKDRANLENDMGAGFYFSNSRDDVDLNYDSTEGADLINRIQSRVEELEMESNIWEDDARVQATAELAGGQNRILEVYLSLQNPVIIGGENETQFEYDYNYDEESDEYGQETGNALDFAEALRAVSYNFDAPNIQTAISNMIEAVEFGGGASSVIQALKHSEGLMYATDNDMGNLVGSEIIRQSFEYMGFDGIIDNTVYNKFGPRGSRMDGIYQDTKHIIAFDPKQIKSVDAESFCEENPNIYKALGIEFDVKDWKDILFEESKNDKQTGIFSKDEQPGIIERMIKALDLDGEPGDITIKAGFNPNQQRNEDGTWGSGGPGETEFKKAKTIEDAEQWAKDNGIEADYSELTLEQANDINRAIFNVNSKLLDEIKLPINKIIIVEGLDVGARVNLDGNLEINPAIWNNQNFTELNSRLTNTRNKITGEINKLKQQLIDDPFGDILSIDEVNRRIDFNKNWLKDLEGKIEFSSVTTNVTRATEHELGHYVDRFLSSNTDYTNEFVTDWNKYNSGDRSQLMYRLDKISQNEGYKLGQYAKTRGNEYFAEAWVAYVNNEHDKINSDLLNVFKKITK
jgi:hypothetical protein